MMSRNAHIVSSTEGGDGLYTEPSGLGPRCRDCGGTAEPGRVTCRKCAARARWQRRKSRHDDLYDDLTEN